MIPYKQKSAEFLQRSILETVFKLSHVSRIVLANKQLTLNSGNIIPKNKKSKGQRAIPTRIPYSKSDIVDTSNIKLYVLMASFFPTIVRI